MNSSPVGPPSRKCRPSCGAPMWPERHAGARPDGHRRHAEGPVQVISLSQGSRIQTSAGIGLGDSRTRSGSPLPLPPRSGIRLLARGRARADRAGHRRRPLGAHPPRPHPRRLRPRGLRLTRIPPVGDGPGDGSDSTDCWGRAASCLAPAGGGAYATLGGFCRPMGGRMVSSGRSRAAKNPGISLHTCRGHVKSL